MAKLEDIKLSELKPDARNANKGTVRGMAALRKSLEKFGAGRSIVLDKHGQVIAGNKTIEQAANLGLDDVIVVRTSGDKLVAVLREDLDLDGDDRARELAYADNRVGELDLDWDATVLAADIEAGLDLSDLFDEDELVDLFEAAGIETPEQVGDDTESQIDRAEELRQEWGVSSGQLWACGPNRVICGDCTDNQIVDTVMGGEVADMCVTDPPYGVNYNPQWRSDVLNQNSTGKVIQNDDNFSWLTTFDIYLPDIAYIWCSSIKMSKVQNYIEDLGFELKYVIVWNKDMLIFGRGNYHWKHESCLYVVRNGKTHMWGGKRDQSTVWDIPAIHSFANGRNKEELGLVGHGNQKPLECMERPIRNHKCDIIYDPFLGSGTTLIACHNLKRVCRGIEIAPEYVAVTLQRYLDHTGEKPQLMSTMCE